MLLVVASRQDYIYIYIYTHPKANVQALKAKREHFQSNIQYPMRVLRSVITRYHPEPGTRNPQAHYTLTCHMSHAVNCQLPLPKASAQTPDTTICRCGLQLHATRAPCPKCHMRIKHQTTRIYVVINLPSFTPSRTFVILSPSSMQ
jgi:hypothetical protein